MGDSFKEQVKSGSRNFKQGKPIYKANLTARTKSCGPTYSSLLENVLNPEQEIGNRENTPQKQNTKQVLENGSNPEGGISNRGKPIYKANLNNTSCRPTPWTIYSATSFLEKCRKVVLQTQIFFSGQPLFSNQKNFGFMV